MRTVKEDIETKELEERQYADKKLQGDILWYVDSSDVVQDAILYGEEKSFEDELDTLMYEKDYDEVKVADFKAIRPILKYLEDWIAIYRVEHNRPKFTGRFIHYKTHEIVETLDMADIPVECTKGEDTETHYVTIYPDDMECWDNINGHDLAMFNRFLNGQEQDEWIPLEDFIDSDNPF